jgi:hypothetical protein
MQTETAVQGSKSHHSNAQLPDNWFFQSWLANLQSSIHSYPVYSQASKHSVDSFWAFGEACRLGSYFVMSAMAATKSWI